MTRLLPVTYSGGVVHDDDNVLHLTTEAKGFGSSLCGEVHRARASWTLRAEQRHICARCWQRWRRGVGDDVRNAWTGG